MYIDSYFQMKVVYSCENGCGDFSREDTMKYHNKETGWNQFLCPECFGLTEMQFAQKEEEH